MSNKNKGIPHIVRECLIAFGISSLIFCKVMSRTHTFIITWFDKTWFAWYKVWHGEKNYFIVMSLARGKVFDAS